MYVCVCTLYVDMNMHVDVQTCAHLFSCVSACVYVCVSCCLNVLVCVSACLPPVHVCSVSVCMYLHVCVCVCVCVCVHTFFRAFALGMSRTECNASIQETAPRVPPYACPPTQTRTDHVKFSCM